HDLSQDLAKQFNVPDTSGALVEDVAPGGPAEKAGIKPGDVIRKVNGQTIDSAHQLTDVITGISPGAVAGLDVIRDGKPLSLRVTLTERPADLTASANGGAGKGPSQGTLRGI